MSAPKDTPSILTLWAATPAGRGAPGASRGVPAASSSPRSAPPTAAERNTEPRSASAALQLHPGAVSLHGERSGAERSGGSCSTSRYGQLSASPSSPAILLCAKRQRMIRSGMWADASDAFLFRKLKAPRRGGKKRERERCVSQSAGFNHR